MLGTPIFCAGLVTKEIPATIDEAALPRWPLYAAPPSNRIVPTAAINKEITRTDLTELVVPMVGSPSLPDLTIVMIVPPCAIGYARFLTTILGAQRHVTVVDRNDKHSGSSGWGRIARNARMTLLRSCEARGWRFKQTWPMGVSAHPPAPQFPSPRLTASAQARLLSQGSRVTARREPAGRSDASSAKSAAARRLRFLWD